MFLQRISLLSKDIPMLTEVNNLEEVFPHTEIFQMGNHVSPKLLQGVKTGGPSRMELSNKTGKRLFKYE